MRTMALFVLFAFAVPGSFLWQTNETFAQSCHNNGCRECRCHNCCKKHRDPPFAPILGSAPAMMAPIVFTPTGPAALPDRPDAQDAPSESDQFKNLLKAILEASAAFAPRESASTSGDLVIDRLESITTQLEAVQNKLADLESRVAEMDHHAASAIGKLDERLKAVESR